MNRASIALDSLRQRRRHAQLASSERAGAYSRRLIRQRHRELLRERWYVFAGIIVIGAIVSLAVKWLIWDSVDAYLIGAMGVRPYGILAVTFTNKAAKEMRKRVAQLTSKTDANRMTICTFHSLGVKDARGEAEDGVELGGFEQLFANGLPCPAFK